MMMLGWALVATAALACDEGVAARVIAHRGGMDSGYPENTLPAFRHAARSGADVLELDLRATRDGAIVVLHDLRVDRTTDGTGAVHTLRLKTLERLDAGNGTRIPTLAQVLEATAELDVDLLLDLKPARYLVPTAVLQEVRARGRLERVIFGVRSLEDRALLAAAHPDMRFLAFARRPGQIAGFLAAGVEIVRVWPHWLDDHPDLITRIRDAGAAIWVTTGEAPASTLRALVSRGVEGVLTDHPAAAVAELGCR